MDEQLNEILEEYYVSKIIYSGEHAIVVFKKIEEDHVAA